MNNTVMNTPLHTKHTGRSALALITAFATIAIFASPASAQTPTPWPTWPPPKDSPERTQVIKAIAALLRESASPSHLRTDLQSPDSAKTRLQTRLGLNFLLPTKMVIVFYEPDVEAAGPCTVQRKNPMYSVFALAKAPITSTDDQAVVTSHFMCCYDPY
jgi:hypothetical protein